MTNKRTETHPCDYDRKETHGDVIYRQDAIDVCMKYNGQGYIWSCIMGDIEKLPSAGADMSSFCDRLWKKAYDRGRAEAQAEPERKTGKWHILDECANEGVYCSECRKKVFKIDFSNTMKWKNFRYCPNCGAKMEEQE